jgi:nucleotide-binding universal stress UspA family protein
MNEPTKVILVGVDETPESQIALRWAVDAAQTGGMAVRVLRAYLPQASQWPAIGAEGYIPATPVDQYQAELDASVAFVRDRLGYEAGSGWLACERAAEAILAEAPLAELVVLGSKARTKLEAAVLGSVATAVTARATCPVVVVRGTPGSGAILVGTDGSTDSERALEFAFEHATRVGAPLSVVYCWQPHGRREGAVEDTDALLQDWLAESMAVYRDKYPAVTVRTKVVEGRPATALAELTADASLVIVGSRGRGGVAGLLLGSVSQSLLHHAACPVAVVRRQELAGS